MADEESVVPPPTPSSDPEPPLPAPPLSAENVRPAALYEMTTASTALLSAFEAVKRLKTSTEKWTDEFWGVSGYNKETATASIDRLIVGTDQFLNTYNDDITVLATQAGA